VTGQRPTIALTPNSSRFSDHPRPTSSDPDSPLMACTTSISFTALYFLHRRAHITQWRISPGEISLSDRRAPDELAVTGHVATDEGHLEEAESFAREVCALVDRFSGFTSYPKLLSHTLHSAVCSRRKLEEARNELVGILIERQKLPGLNPWPTPPRVVGTFASEVRARESGCG